MEVDFRLDWRNFGSKNPNDAEMILFKPWVCDKLQISAGLKVRDLPCSFWNFRKYHLLLLLPKFQS